MSVHETSSAMGLALDVLADRDGRGGRFFDFVGGDGGRGCGKVLGEEGTVEFVGIELGLGCDVEDIVVSLEGSLVGRKESFLLAPEMMLVAVRKSGEFG